ncbi:alpha/beta hydrolase [uncultured Psychrobacter sp.]|uniref:alpha/beta hydrolase n=1 Tax=uncultured Psychrobacter sp. TaxID=259303 RepID=UPI0025988CEF|nr:alpha/beta hydrolase [uncultured Psychrobacter sp.]
MSMQKYKKLSVSVAVTGVALWSLHTTANASPGLKLLNAITPNGEVSVIKDLNYGNEPDQNLDIYYPKELAKAVDNHQKPSAEYPFVVFVHGGSWESGNKDQYAFVGQSLAKAGYVTAVINYRKAPQFIYPEFVKDTAQAIAWSHENADKFFADANRMAVVGHSAGAFNAVAAVSNADFLKPYGLQPSDIKAVVGIAGPYSYDFRKFSSRTVFPEGATPDEVMPDRLLKAGSSGQQPDYLLMTAENDKVVHISNAEKMVKALTDVGANVSTEEIKGATHASIIAAMSTSLTWVNPVRAQVLTYLDQKLQPQTITTKAKAS